MSSKFYQIPVKDVVKTTAECTLISFKIDEALKEQFDYKQGQYLTLKALINGEEVRRSYSLCSAPLDGEWKVAVKKIPGGKFSTFANDVLRKGDVLEVMPPDGRFFVAIAPDQKKNYIAFAAGSGITPILSIIKTHLHQEPESTFTLFYVNQSVASIILKEEIEGLKNQFLSRFEVFHFLTREERNIPLFNGRIDREKLDIIFGKMVDQSTVDDYFICGPEAMIFLVRDYLKEIGVASKKVHFELFGTASSNGNGPAKKAPVIDSNVQSEVHILEGGKTFKFKIPKGSNNILDAALERQADLPFACKGGVCCTCRAKVVEGKVDMEINYGLEEEEVDAGYVLTCQAIPVSEKVVVDFDA